MTQRTQAFKEEIKAINSDIERLQSKLAPLEETLAPLNRRKSQWETAETLDSNKEQLEVFIEESVREGKKLTQELEDVRRKIQAVQTGPP